MSASIETPSPSMAIPHGALSSVTPAVEPTVLADTDAPTLPGPSDAISLTLINESNQLEARRRQQQAASRRCEWVAKVAARMIQCIQLTDAETSHLVGWYLEAVLERENA
ncbi:hypothetical protein FIBSPDRAFT_857748 [Athelia psychrophila]|uniref:Uncharacterized protein n=1 Tax=Athelia psychrophila TaxID=1759441 RepID=A0A166MGM2_9AGAM|nr:hypothetical protein FIBSPDRAFT_857748 [Fibularhizoctonia sp. CBS 109695]